MAQAGQRQSEQGGKQKETGRREIDRMREDKGQTDGRLVREGKGQEMKSLIYQHINKDKRLMAFFSTTTWISRHQKG